MIYAIEAVGLGLVKIGRAINPSSRLKELQTGCPVPIKLIATVPWHDSSEGLIHRRFAEWRHCGEWFRASKEVADFIQIMACPNSTDQEKFNAAMEMLKPCENCVEKDKEIASLKTALGIGKPKRDRAEYMRAYRERRSVVQ